MVPRRCCHEGVIWCHKKSYCLRIVSVGVSKLSDGVRKVSDGVRKVSDDVKKV